MRLLLYPFSFLYAIITNIRNLLFDMGILASKEYDLPIICIGNLSAGGTGKTPLTDYVVSLLSDYKTAILSRGYGRKTQGFKIVEIGNKAGDVGDEPLLLKQKHPNALVVVDENRTRAIERIIKNYPEIDLILMDDGFQHRSVIAGLNILLTHYHLPYYKDFLLPMGTLRESIKASERANIIIVSKSPKDLNPTEKKGIIQQLGVFITQRCYFSNIKYKNWKCFSNNTELLDEERYSITLVSGIANPNPLIKKLEKDGHDIALMQFANHHNYTESDISAILKQYNQDNSAKKLILTTEKDAVKLKTFENDFEDTNLYVIPIETELEEKENFDKQILNYVRSNTTNC
ncbi:MAG: tetraacyldisaccharide 4'-kinase [Bacteroidota bacterium]|nr:tetraacyldisaccharide 4'-kinase [Bacteroidota bacterium]